MTFSNTALQRRALSLYDQPDYSAPVADLPDPVGFEAIAAQPVGPQGPVAPTAAPPVAPIPQYGPIAPWNGDYSGYGQQGAQGPDYGVPVDPRGPLAQGDNGAYPPPPPTDESNLLGWSPEFNRQGFNEYGDMLARTIANSIGSGLAGQTPQSAAPLGGIGDAFQYTPPPVFTGDLITERATNPLTYAFGLPMAARTVAGAALGVGFQRAAEGAGAPQWAQTAAELAGETAPFAGDIVHAGRAVGDLATSGARGINALGPKPMSLEERQRWFDAIKARAESAAPDAARSAGAEMPPPSEPPIGDEGATPSGDIPRGDAGIQDALARKQEALHTPDNPILGPEGSLRRKVLAPIYNPSANMPREVHVANNARVSVQSALYGEFNRAEQAAARSVQTAFDDHPPAYIGSIKNKVTGTAADYLERPSMYTDVTPELEAAKGQWFDAGLAARNTARGGYNVDVGLYEQKDPRGVYVPHVQSADTIDQSVESVSSSLSSKGSVNKTRGYDTLFLRVQARPDLVPELDLEVLADRHAQSLATLAARETFKQGVGGLDKMQVLEATHPNLAARVQAVRKDIQWAQGTKARLGDQISEALDTFSASPKEPADAAMLQDALETNRLGITDPQISQYIANLKTNLRDLQPFLHSADTGDYVFNKDTSRYMLKPQSDSVSSVLKTSVNNSFVEGAINVADDLRGLQLGPDFSPLAIQGTLGAMSHPEIPIMDGVGLARAALSTHALNDLADPATVARYEFATGRSFGHAGAEFRQEGRGLERLPLIGGAIHNFNSALERVVEYGTFKAWENDSALLQRFGTEQNVADHEAANSISKFVPRLNPAETGRSVQRARLERLPLISSSFRFAPPMLAKDAATAVGKIVAGAGNPATVWETLSGREQLALLRGVSFASTWAAISVGSAVASAEYYGDDVTDKIKSVLDPNSGRFGNVLIGKSGGFGIGGPMRTTIRGLWPVAVSVKNGVEALPHLGNFVNGSLSNIVSTPFAFIRNKDYSGKPIITSKTAQGRVGQILEYVVEQLNLTAGSAMSDIRRGEPQNIPSDVASQLAGVNYYDTSTNTVKPKPGPLPRVVPLTPPRR